MQYVNWREGEEAAAENKSAEEVKAEVAEWSETTEWQEKDFPGLRKAIRWILLAGIGLLPIWFLPFTAPADILVLSKQILLFGVVMASVVLWLTMIVRQSGAVFKKSGWEWGIAAVLGAVLASAIASAQLYNSFTSGSGFITWGLLGIFFFLVFNFFEKKDLGQLSDCFLAGSALAVLLGIFNLHGWPVFKWLNVFFPENITLTQQFNTVGSLNGLGAMSALGLVLLLTRYLGVPVLSLAEREKWKNRVWPIGHGIIGLAFAWNILLLNWWVFYLVLGVGMAGIITGVVLASRTSQFAFKLGAGRLIVPLLILVLTILLGISSRYFNFNTSHLLLQKDLPIEVSLSQRASWSIAKEVVNQRPVLGMGLENFTLAYDQFKPVSINNTLFWSTRFTNSASEFFDWLVEKGIIGLAALVFLFFYIVRSALRWSRSSVGDHLSDWWFVWPSFLSAVVLFALFPFHLVLLATFWLFIAMLALADSREEFWKIRMDIASLPSLAASCALVAVLVLGAIGGYLIFQRYGANIYFARAARINNAKAEDFDRSITLLDKAASINGNDDLYLSNLAGLLLQRINLELANKKDKREVVQKRLTSLTQAVGQVAARLTSSHRNDALNWFNAAYIYENLIPIVQGADEAAISSYNEFLKRAPNDPNGHMRLGGIYLSRADQLALALNQARIKKIAINNAKEAETAMVSDYKNAEDAFKKATELKGDLATALYSLGIVYERQGRVKESIKQLELARRTDANNASLAFELGLLYYRDAQKDKALTEMARAVNLFSDFANARWYLALMLEEKGEVDLAKGQLAAILKIEVNKDNLVVIQKLASLEEGKREIPPGKVTGKRPLEAPAPRQK